MIMMKGVVLSMLWGWILLSIQLNQWNSVPLLAASAESIVVEDKLEEHQPPPLFLHISPVEKTDEFPSDAATLLEQQQESLLAPNQYLINTGGLLGGGYDFYDKPSLTVQLIKDGPTWTFYRRHGDSNNPNLYGFVGETTTATSKADGFGTSSTNSNVIGKVSCSFIKYLHHPQHPSGGSSTTSSAASVSGQDLRQQQEPQPQLQKEIVTGVIHDRINGIWYEIKPNNAYDGFSTVTVINDEDIPESADPTELQPIPIHPSELDDDDFDGSDEDSQLLTALKNLQSYWNNKNNLLWKIPSIFSKESATTTTTETVENTNIDALIIWTTDAECIKSSLPSNCQVDETTNANMMAAIQLMMSETNTAYLNSSINLTITIRHAQRIDSKSYQDPSNFPLALWYASTSSEVKKLRYQYDADIVLMIIDNTKMSNVAGMAYNNYMTPGKRGWLFAVVASQVTAVRYVAAHEFGHLLGCFHDRGTQNGCSAADKNWGHRDPQGRFATIMSYRCKRNQCDQLEADKPCPRIPYFAGSPNVTYGMILDDDDDSGSSSGSVVNTETPDINIMGLTQGNDCRGQIMSTKDLVANVLPRQQRDCFSAVATVQVLATADDDKQQQQEEGLVGQQGSKSISSKPQRPSQSRIISMAELKVGDQVLTSSGTYQSVYAIDHYSTTKPTQFLQIYTWSRHKPLEISPYHLVFVVGKEDYPIPAHQVKIGDRLRLGGSGGRGGSAGRTTRVVSINLIVRQGLYNPLTMDGTIVVDGIITSTYSAVYGSSSHFEIGGGRWKVLSYHDLLHYLTKPLRVMANYIPPELLQNDDLMNDYSDPTTTTSRTLEQQQQQNAVKENEEVIHWYCQLGRLLANWWEDQSVILQVSIWIVVLVIYGIVWILHGCSHLLNLLWWCSMTGYLVYELEQQSMIRTTKKKLNNKEKDS